MPKRILAMLTAALTVCGTLYPATTGFAHCPDSPDPAPYLDTFFAPIEASGTKLKLELVASGLTSPLKGTVAPGLPNHLFVVDQAGIAWAVNLTTGAKTVFLNVGPTGLNRLVTLGVLGPNTFDERGLLGLAFHPDFQQNGLLYTYTSEPNAGAPTFPTTLPVGSPPDHQNVVAEWLAIDPANPALGVAAATRRELCGSTGHSSTTTAVISPSGPTAISTFRWATGVGPTTPTARNSSWRTAPCPPTPRRSSVTRSTATPRS